MRPRVLDQAITLLRKEWGLTIAPEHQYLTPHAVGALPRARMFGLRPHGREKVLNKHDSAFVLYTTPREALPDKTIDAAPSLAQNESEPAVEIAEGSVAEETTVAAEDLVSKTVPSRAVPYHSLG